MTEQAKNILLSAAAEIETMYNQGILDGITLIRNMLDEKPDESMEWTPELIRETCDAFIEKYTSPDSEGNVTQIPDVPNIVDDIPQECKDAGMSHKAYSDLMSFLNECENGDNDTNPSFIDDEEKNIVPVPDINAIIHTPVELDKNNGFTPFPNMIPEGSSIIAIPNSNPEEVIDVVELANISFVEDDSVAKTQEQEELILGEILSNAVIATENGKEIKLADCIAEAVVDEES